MALGAEGAAKPRLQDVTWHGQAVLSTADKGTMCFLSSYLQVQLLLSRS